MAGDGALGSRIKFASRILAGLLFLLTAGCVATPSSIFVVSIPVADVRAEPGSRLAIGVHDPLQETQLLYGERVRVFEHRDGWARIEAVEQPEQTHHRLWEGYPGWVREDALSELREWKPNAVVGARWATVWHDGDADGPLAQLPMGTYFIASDTGGALLRVRLIDGREGWASPGDITLLSQLKRLPQDQRRRLIVQAANALLGDAYVWGGRSPVAAPPLVASPMATTAPWNGAATSGGVDCSGLVNLAYRTAGITIPRDAHEQRLRARPANTLQPADLVFLSSPDDPKKIVHVMLYAGEGWLIEGPGTGQAVRRITVQERLGLSVAQLVDGGKTGKQTVYLGSYVK